MHTALAVAVLAVLLITAQGRQPTLSDYNCGLCNNEVWQSQHCNGKKFQVVVNAEYQPTWSGADKMCRDFLPGGSLASINSLKEQICVEAYLTSLEFPESAGFWIGGVRSGLEAWGTQFRWMKQAQLMNYTNWADGEPSTNPDRRNYYVYIKQLDTRGFKWFSCDSNYSNRHWALCQTV